MFRNFLNLFHIGTRSKVAYISRMKNPQQVVRNLHAQGLEVCVDQAEMLMHGVHDVGIDDADIDDICGLEA